MQMAQNSGTHHPDRRLDEEQSSGRALRVTFLASITMQVWRARREGALMGSLYTLSVIGMLYVALFEYGPTHPVSALCYGGVVVVLVEVYRRFIRKL
jgi:hypothetical protein